MLSKPKTTTRPPAGLALALLCGLGLLAARPAQAQYYALTPFDITLAGATNTELHGLNDGGMLVGTYEDGNGVNQGFLVSTPTAVLTLSGPSASASATNPFLEINKINNAGVYAGDFEAADAAGTNSPQGFTGSGGSVNPTALPASAAYGINNLGVSVGTVLSSDGFNYHSYRDATPFDVPGYVTSEATGINDAGTIVGQADTDATTGPTVSYLKTGNAFSFLSLPGTGAVDIFATDINNAGAIVGAFDTVAGGPTTGFVDFGGVVSQVLFPSADSTEVDGINSLGEIVGTYTATDANGNITRHGFIGAPVPEAATTVSLGLLLALGLGGMALSARKKARPHA